MARNVFFSFDFDDVCATNIVRNSNVVRAEEKKLPFADYSLYEKVKNTPATIKSAIDEGLKNTSVTVIVNGGNTYASRWVRYEIAKSLERGNALMVVDVDGVGLHPQPTKGPNPLAFMCAVPWDSGAGFGILEYIGGKWQAFSALDHATKATSAYPSSFYIGKPWQLHQRFTFHKHWNDLGVQMYFPTSIQQAANEAGHPLG